MYGKLPISLLQALVVLDRGEEYFSDPVIPDDDGVELIPCTGDYLTYEGEINKLTANVAMGRKLIRAGSDTCATPVPSVQMYVCCRRESTNRGRGVNFTHR